MLMKALLGHSIFPICCPFPCGLSGLIQGFLSHVRLILQPSNLATVLLFPHLLREIRLHFSIIKVLVSISTFVVAKDLFDACRDVLLIQRSVIDKVVHLRVVVLVVFIVILGVVVVFNSRT